MNRTNKPSCVDPAVSSAVPLRVVHFYLLLLATLGLFSLFAYLTQMQHLGLGSASDPERWQAWRIPLVVGWLLFAALLFEGRGRRAWRQSLVAAWAVGGALALLLAGFWQNVSGSGWIYLSGAAYVQVAACVSCTFKRPGWASLCALLLVLLQWVVDVVVLGSAGNFRIH